MSIVMYICLGMIGPVIDNFSSYLNNQCVMVLNDCMKQHQRDAMSIENVYKTCVFINRDSLLDLTNNDKDFTEQ